MRGPRPAGGRRAPGPRGDGGAAPAHVATGGGVAGAGGGGEGGRRRRGGREGVRQSGPDALTTGAGAAAEERITTTGGGRRACCILAPRAGRYRDSGAKRKWGGGSGPGVVSAADSGAQGRPRRLPEARKLTGPGPRWRRRRRPPPPLLVSGADPPPTPRIWALSLLRPHITLFQSSSALLVLVRDAARPPLDDSGQSPQGAAFDWLPRELLGLAHSFFPAPPPPPASGAVRQREDLMRPIQMPVSP